MYEIEYNLKHCKNDTFVDNIIIKVDSLKEMEQDFLASIVNSHDNAINQIARKIYPENKVSFELEYVSSNFLNNDNAVNDFLVKADKVIKDQIENNKKNVFFKKRILKISKDYLIENLSYAQLEKIKRKREYKIATWKREKEEFILKTSETKKNKQIINKP